MVLNAATERKLFHRNQIRKMESKFMKPGEDVLIEKGLKWHWAWIKERGGDPFGSWCQKESRVRVSVCCPRVCNEQQKSSTTVPPRRPWPQRRDLHLQLTSCLPGATATDVGAPMSGRVCGLKIRVCSFIAEHDLSFTISHPLRDLCEKKKKRKSSG